MTLSVVLCWTQRQWVATIILKTGRWRFDDNGLGALSDPLTVDVIESQPWCHRGLTAGSHNNGALLWEDSR
jgi:hypothetical protein